MACAERAEDCLCDDGADLAGCGRDAVRGGAVTRGEAFAGDDECGSVGAWRMVSNACGMGEKEARVRLTEVEEKLG